MTGDGLLRRAREYRGLDQRALAERLGVSRASVSDVEVRGARASLTVLARYGAALGLTLHVSYRTETGEIIE